MSTSPVDLGITALGGRVGANRGAEDASDVLPGDGDSDGDGDGWLLPEGVGVDQLLALAEEVLGSADARSLRPGQVSGPRVTSG